MADDRPPDLQLILEGLQQQLDDLTQAFEAHQETLAAQAAQIARLEQQVEASRR